MIGSGGPPALRGFRLQTLYILDRILSAPDGLVLRLETVEDLAIYDSSGGPVEFVQVKAYTEPLTLSALKAEGKHKFLRRVVERAATGARQKLVSFGPIGPELEGAWKGDDPHRRSVRAKLTEFTPEEQDALFQNLHIIWANERKLVQQVLTTLAASFAGGEAHHASGLLDHWIRLESERQSSLTKAGALARLAVVGRYLAERATHHQEWFRSIQPIEVDPELERDSSELRQQFFQGIGARYEHIAAGVDIPRPEKVEEIATAFEDHRLVVIHGVSGQGKSALAYRFLHDHTPSAIRFEVRSIEGLRQAQAATRALVGHARALETPLYLYIDVQPRESDWLDIVDELVRYPAIRVLVTVREEDWNRTRAMTWPSFSDVSMTFEEAEARRLFGQITAESLPGGILDFDDAWQRFDGKGPLMEFVYLVTQNLTLRQRLELQVQQLHRELSGSEMQFLRVIAVSSAYGARLRLRDLVNQLDLDKPQAVLQRLEREYLVRVSEHGRHVEGLHAIRSEILCDLLVDSSLAPWREAASVALSAIDEDDLEIFLLHAFSRHYEDRESLVENLPEPCTWSGLGNVLRALLWLDLREYADDNRSVIEAGIEEFGNAWKFLPMWDVANLASFNQAVAAYGIHNLEVFSDERRTRIEELRQSRTESHAPFERSREWLTNLRKPPQKPNSKLDWLRGAEALFWVGFWDLSSPTASFFDGVDPGRVVGDQGLDVAADVLYAYSFFGDTTVGIEAAREVALDVFCGRYDVLALEDGEEGVRAHFLWRSDEVLAEVLRGEVDQAHSEALDEPDAFHREAMIRVDLLRKLLPDRPRIGTQGYGHLILLPEAPFDSTQKFVDRKYLYPPWALRLNRIFCNLVEYERRLETWEEYAEVVLDIRAAIVEHLAHLKSVLVRFLRRQSFIDVAEAFSHRGGLWHEMVEILRWSPRLPRSAVDEWGLGSEDSGSTGLISKVDDQRLLAKELVAASKLRGFHRSFSDFTTALYNFFAQGWSVLLGTPYKSRPGPWHRAGNLPNILAQAGYSEKDVRLSVLNFAKAVEEFRTVQERFSKLIGRAAPADRLEAIENEESRLLPLAWALWYTFALTPLRMFAKPTSNVMDLITFLAGDADDDLKALCNGLNKEPGLDIMIHGPLKGYEGKPTVWFKCDLEDTLDKAPVLESVLRIVDLAWLAAGKRLFSYVQQVFRPQIAIMFTYRGGLIQSEAYVFPTRLLAEEGGSLLAQPQWRWLPREIPQEIVEHFSLPYWRGELLTLVEKLRSSFVTLRWFACWLASVGEAPPCEPSRSSSRDRIRTEGYLCLIILARRALNAALDAIKLLNEGERSEEEVAGRGGILVRFFTTMCYVGEFVVASERWGGVAQLDEVAEFAGRLTDEVVSIDLVCQLWTGTLLDSGLLSKDERLGSNQEIEEKK